VESGVNETNGSDEKEKKPEKVDYGQKIEDSFIFVQDLDNINLKRMNKSDLDQIKYLQSEFGKEGIGLDKIFNVEIDNNLFYSDIA